MQLTTLILLLAGASVAAFMLGRWKAVSTVGGPKSMRDLHSLPGYYGYYAAIWCVIPGLVFLGFWLAFSDVFVLERVTAVLPEDLRSLPAPELSLVINDIKNMVAGQFINPERVDDLKAAVDLYVELQARSRWMMTGLLLLISVGGFAFAWSRVQPAFRARNRVEGVVKVGLILASTLAIFTTIGILFSVVFEAVRFFQKVPVSDFLFGLTWSPQTAIRADQVGSSGAFGALPLFAGTILISSIAMLVAVPIGLMIAIYLSEYATSRVRAVVKPMLEVLAGIPTVVYGYFAALTVAPLLRDLGISLGLDVASESALGAGLVMGVMIIPFVSSLSDDVINAVPQAMRDGSYGLGATRSETIKRVVIPAALPGIVGSILLAVSRAIGETMIVVMAAGLSANLTVNPLEAVTTVTVQIVTLLVGDQEFDSAKTLAAFALGLMLFVVTLILNVIALQVVRRYREEYE
ncbi:MAG: phosphate ABC transporter permease subunit PstC [Gammaproteobacteria bacterium]|nr:phosphate ABC transporter permease subunit PstC [Gammaproteobacteria bacterium]MBT8443468.1 phosphate ABC transporter permease subunit PstC [Gammaproteobacteria bacterium]NND36964.1 phosphate ABC transporter permease subunit PstC [Gammaproteobacteria bacterium]